MSFQDRRSNRVSSGRGGRGNGSGFSVQMLREAGDAARAADNGSSAPQQQELSTTSSGTYIPSTNFDYSGASQAPVVTSTARSGGYAITTGGGAAPMAVNELLPPQHTPVVAPPLSQPLQALPSQQVPQQPQYHHQTPGYQPTSVYGGGGHHHEAPGGFPSYASGGIGGGGGGHHHQGGMAGASSLHVVPPPQLGGHHAPATAGYYSSGGSVGPGSVGPGTPTHAMPASPRTLSHNQGTYKYPSDGYGGGTSSNGGGGGRGKGRGGLSSRSRGGTRTFKRAAAHNPNMYGASGGSGGSGSSPGRRKGSGRSRKKSLKPLPNRFTETPRKAREPTTKETSTMSRGELLAYSKKPRSVRYNPYKGGVSSVEKNARSLGPDVQSSKYQEAAGRAQRMRDYAKKQRVRAADPVPGAALKRVGKQHAAEAAAANHETKRDRALKYSSKVQKPTTAAAGGRGSSRGGQRGKSSQGKQPHPPQRKLSEHQQQIEDEAERLLQQHDRDRAEVEAIKRSVLGL